MRKSAALIAALSIVLLAPMALAGGDGVAWSDASWEKILEQAKSENKYIMIDFYTTWCSPCKKMDKVTFTDAEVMKFLGANIAVKYDCDKGFGDKIADDYQVVFYPTTVVVGPDGQEVDRYLGYLGPEEYMEVIGGYTKGIGTVGWYKEQVAENPDDIELLRELGMKYVATARIAEATECLDKVWEMDPDDERGWHAEIVYSLGEANYTAEKWADAKKHYEKVLSEFPDSKIYDRTLTMLARVEHELGNDDVAVAAYKKYLDRHPDDPSAMNGFAWFCSQRAIGLDLALPIALKAVELSNRDPGILDTLAEVYFAMGDFDNALKIGKEALASDPEDTYFKDQVEKYKKAKEEAEPQAAR
jgi:thioredoxin-like negative regulator of GroEL